MEMVQVESSNVEAIGHHRDTIHVRYKGGSMYTGTCTAEQHSEIVEASSIGSALRNSGIKLSRIKGL